MRKNNKPRGNNRPLNKWQIVIAKPRLHQLENSH